MNESHPEADTVPRRQHAREGSAVVVSPSENASADDEIKRPQVRGKPGLKIVRAEFDVMAGHRRGSFGGNS
jgi:hypothetical protein